MNDLALTKAAKEVLRLYREGSLNEAREAIQHHDCQLTQIAVAVEALLLSGWSLNMAWWLQDWHKDVQPRSR